MSEMVTHPLDPVFDEKSKVLILGTMPSPVSRKLGFYYAHPQNRFWKIMEALFPLDPPGKEPEQRRQWALRHQIALWDVLASCSINGASDQSIRNPVPNDLSRILSVARIETIYTTGSKANQLYNKFCLPHSGIPAIALPSPSAANCARHTLDTLTKEYRIILHHIP